MPPKFLKFLKKIIVDGDWQYHDGTSMTEDAKIVLNEVQSIQPKKKALRCECKSEKKEI